MAKKFFPKKRARKMTGGRRRLQTGLTPYIVAGGAKLLKSGYSRFRNKRANAVAYKQKVAKSNFKNRLESSDNITTAKAIVVGKQRPIGFQEKVSRTVRPPVFFKRNYAFNVETEPGRKGMFAMDVNLMNTNDLQLDLTTYKSTLATDTTFSAGVMLASGDGDGAMFYIDKHTEKIRMINSSTLSLTGKVHLIAHKRDSGSTYGGTGAIISPINMLQYYSTLAPAPVAADVGGGQTVGRGWVFTNGGTNSTSYSANHNMPGSSLNGSGSPAIMDPTLSFASPHVKDGWNFWFRKVGTSTFSLKPGQQFNSSFVFNDLPIINREEQAQYNHIAGVTHSIVVEFEGGIVGDSTAVTGDGVVSIGTTQLSVVRESLRTLGQKNTLKSKILLQTVPLASVTPASQVVINADDGQIDIGVAFDA